MLSRRIIYIAILIGTGTFASFYGGNIPYLLFYLVLLLPVFCILYTLYVNFRFKIHQTIGKVKLVKRELIPYRFVLANEDLFTFTSIKVTFFDDKSHIKQESEERDLCLGPKTSKILSGTVCGDYRGIYEIGAKSVEIQDFLYLFKITYPIRNRLRMIVSPRIVPLDKLKLQNFIQDQLNTKNSFQPQDPVYEMELRKYQNSDSRKLIHWKASAKKQELLSKKILDIEKPDTLLFFDLHPVSEFDEVNLVVEDKIIELAIGISRLFFQERVPLQVLYQDKHFQSKDIKTKRNFDDFYQHCSELSFQAKDFGTTLLLEWIQTHGLQDSYLLITSFLDKISCAEILRLRKLGLRLSFFYIRKNREDDAWVMLKAMEEAGIEVYDIWMEDDLLQAYGLNSR